jgi:peptidoglycan/LPS O-acetylase OafA/YrhL
VDVRAERFPLFDSLRAIAALSVVLFHGAWQQLLVFHPDNPLGRYASRLNVGVTVFFVISGFLLYRPFVAARLGGAGAPAVGAYAWRRFLRIVPAYWVALTVVAVVLGLTYVFTASGLARFYGFAQIYSPDDAARGLGQAWTLCVEVTFYALLPLWALALRRVPGGVRTELASLALLALGGLAFAALVARAYDPNLPEDVWAFMQMPNYFDAFAAGMALAVLSAWWSGRAGTPGPVAFVERRPWVPWGVALLAFAAAAQLGTVGEQTDREYFVTHRLFVVVAMGLLLPAIFGDPSRGSVRRVLGWRPLLWVGLVSYGVYLYHVLAFDRLFAWGWDTSAPAGEIARLMMGVLFTIALAAVSYYLVERPALRLKRLVGGAPAEDQPGAASAPARPQPPAR